MSPISPDTFRTLTGFDSGGRPVTSCYLDVDGRRLVSGRDVEQELERTLRTARQRTGSDASVKADLDRIEGYVRDGFDRSRVRGLAFFSCSGAGLWEVVRLPARVRSRVVVNDQPAVGQLEAIAEGQRRLGVLLVDRQRSRMFVFELDELVEHSEQVDELPRDYDTRGERERGGVQGHVDALASQHVRQAAALAFATFQSAGFEHLVVGGPDDLVSEVQGALHPYLRERFAGRIPVTAQASASDLRVAAARCEEEVERARETALVRRLLDAVGSGGRAVTGLEQVLAALADKRVEHLIVSDDYSEEGWRCETTGALHAVRPHRDDPSTLHHVEDVVEEAIEAALAQRVAVEMVVGNADLDVHGRIGALLRY